MKKQVFPVQNGFDALRWLAALTIVVSHFAGLAEIEAIPMMPTREAVQLFFILSGMLTYRSFSAKPDTLAFYRRRARRILPAYWGVIFFCLLVGLLFTEMPLRNFVQHPQTGSYLLWNTLMLNWLQPALPGVFTDHVLPVMDGSLWTMKFEMAFYFVLPFVVFLLRHTHKWGVFIGGYVLFVAIQIIAILIASHTSDSSLRILTMRGASQAVCFWSGMMVYEAFGWIAAHRRYVFPIALAVAVLGKFWGPLNILWPLAYAILILFIGTAIPFLSHARRLPNITYELFLIHFPIIQAAVEADLPSHLGTTGTFAAILFASLFFAYLLHRCVKPITDKR